MPRPPVCPSSHRLEFTYPCTRCGYCCSIEVCNMGRELGGDHAPPCKFLNIGSNGKASCRIFEAYPQLQHKMHMFGCGCCTSGKIIHALTGEERPWAPLPAELKRDIALMAYEEMVSRNRPERTIPAARMDPLKESKGNQRITVDITRRQE